MRSAIAIVVLTLVSLTSCQALPQGGLHPKESAAAQAEGFQHLEAREFDAAIEDFTRAIELDHTNADAFDGRATARAAIGELRLAAKDREKADELALERSVSADLPLYIAQHIARRYWPVVIPVGGTLLVIVWLAVRRFNILIGAKTQDFDRDDR